MLSDQPRLKKELALAPVSARWLTQGSGEVKLGEITPNRKQVSGMA